MENNKRKGRCRVCHYGIELRNSEWVRDGRSPSLESEVDSQEEQHICTTCVNRVLVENGIRERKETTIIA